MPLLFQHRIYQSDLVNNPGVFYIFGDNEARRGRGGQAKECRGHSNAIGIATKIRPSNSEGSFWSDEDYDRCKAIIDSDFQPVFDALKSGNIVVCPSDGIGSGLSRLPVLAPRLFAYIRSQIKLSKTL